MEGTPFGRYTLLELIGRGGMGEVWRAHDPAVDRVVALKVLTPNVAGDEVYEERFRREARAAAGLDEPHVVPIFDFGEVQGRLYVTMRLIHGEDLQTMLQAGPLPPERAVTIIEQIAAALHAAHRIGLVHRDVKPSNIRVAENDFAYLIDFGIAHAAGETGLTSTGAAIGTMAYMAPERFSTGHADPRSDIYALTCVLYECLTGQQPFPGPSAEQQLAGHLAAPPPRPSRTQPGVPAQFDTVIATGMAKNPDQRYQTTLELAKAARAALTPITTPIPQPTQPAPAMAAPPPPVFGPQAPTAVHAGVAPAVPAHGAPTRYAPPPPPPVFEPPAPRRRWSRRTIIIAAAAAIAVVGAGIAAGVTLSHRSSQTTTPSAGPPDTPKPKPVGPLDGSYTAQFGPRTELLGKPYTGSLVSEPLDGPWSIRSACPAKKCVATASFGRPAKLSTLVFDDIDRRWVAVAVTTGKCDDVDTDVWAIFTLQPQPDGKLSGEYIEAASQCLSKQTLIFTRTGDVDPNVQVADPDTQPPRVISIAQGLHGRYHRTYTFSNGSGLPERDYAIRTDCLRTGDRCISLAYDPDVFEALVFAAGKWTTNYSGDTSCQSGGKTHVQITAEFPAPPAPQDPIPVLSGRGRVESTGDCKKVPDFDEKFERTGD